MKTMEAKQPPKLGLGARGIRFFRELQAELKKVIWPNRRQTAMFTGVVIVAVALLGSIMYVADLLFQFLLGLV